MTKNTPHNNDEHSENEEFDIVDEGQYNDDTEIDDMEDMADKKVSKLKKQLAQCQQERQEYLDGWQRVKADFVNVKKQQEQEQHKATQHAAEDMVTDLLPTLDSFDMAFANTESWERVDETWRKGVEYIYSQLMDALEQRGVAPINPEGEVFDHNKHSSLEAVPTDDESKDNMVARVLQKGYMLRDKVIRPAKVAVYVVEKTEETN